MFNAWGYGVYIFFASFMIISVIFVYFCVPETKGIPLEVMDRLFEIRPVWRAHGTVLDELKEREEEFIRNAEGVDLAEKVEVERQETRGSGDKAVEV